MTQLLKTLLKIGLEEPRGPALQRIVEREVPRQLTAWHDDTVEPVRELLLSTAIESTTLIQTEMAATVLEGAEPWTCMRQACKVIPMKANALTIPIGEVGSYATEVAEGAEIPIATQDYTSTTLTAKKYGVRPVITDEMIADALYPVIEMEVRKAGAKMENTLNRLALTAAIDGHSANEHDTSGSNQGALAIAKTIGLIKADGFIPDTLIMCPEFEAGLIYERIASTYPGADAAANGRVPPTAGLTPYVTSVADASATQTWEYNSDGDIGAVVMDSQNGTVIGERQPITVKTYDDIVRGLKGMTVTARWAVGTLQANAGGRIEY